jgi:hypothetical protein
VPISSQESASRPEGVTWDESAWPLVRISLRDGKDERYVWLLQQFETLFARRERYVLMIDSTALSTIPSAPTRHTIGKWQKEHEEDTRKSCVGSAIVISSRLVRGALTAMEWVQRPVIKHHYPATRREALDWCIATVEEAGLTFSATAREILQSPNA